MDPSITRRILRSLESERREGESLLRRLSTQLEFARELKEALSAKETMGWDELIREAESKVEAFDPSGEPGHLLDQHVEAAEKVLGPIAKAAKTFTVHCVGHGHIDMNWMWSWPETVATTHDTFAAMLNFMREYPQFTFSQSQASVYAAMQKYHPELFEEIRQRVKEGRWEVTAAQWVEGDKNMAHGEALARHLLYTRAYFQEHFDLEPEDVPVDWEPDTFGHANTIPSIMARGGVKYYYCCRPGGGFDHARTQPLAVNWDKQERPMLFWWEGPEGSRLLVNRESTWYNSYVNVGANVALPAVAFFKETGLRDWLNVYGVGNHGGGPTRAEIEWYLEADTFPCYPNIVFSRARVWFEKVEALILSDASDRSDKSDNTVLPVLKGELNYEFTGCYTSQSAIKRANRLGEVFCMQADALDVVVDTLAHSNDLTLSKNRRSQIRDAWLNVLFNQFHDILPGSGVAATREHALGLFQETGAITGAIKWDAFSRLASTVDTAALLPENRTYESNKPYKSYSGNENSPYTAGAGIGAGETGLSASIGASGRFRPWIVYNPCPWPRTDYVIVDLYDCDLEPDSIVARDEEGVNHPVMFLEKGNDWGHDKLTVLFYARDVPGLGYKTYMLCEGVADAQGPGVSAHEGERFETPDLELGFDRYSSGLKRLIDRRNKSEIAEDPFTTGEWLVVTERPRGMTAWRLGGEVNSGLRVNVPLLCDAFRVQGIRYNDGTGAPLNTSLAFRVVSQLRVPGTESTVKLTAIVHSAAPRIDWCADIDWREIGTLEKGIPGLVIGCKVLLGEIDMEPTFETPFGSVNRDSLTQSDVPSINYVHMPGHHKDGSYSCLTLLQDCKYGFEMYGSDNCWMRVLRSSFDPDHAPEVRKSKLRYAVYVHDKPATPSELTRLGQEFNQPLIPFPATLQEGKEPLSRSFAESETPGVVLTCLKRPLVGTGLLVRLVEYDGKDTQVSVSLDLALVKGLKKAQTVDLLERPCPGTATLTGNRLSVHVPAHGIVSVVLSA